MTITKHARQRIEQRSKIRGLDAQTCLARLHRVNHQTDVAVILGAALTLSGDKTVYLVAICRTGQVKTVLWEAEPSPEKLRVRLVVS